jgi:signal transduction histidine kinase
MEEKSVVDALREIPLFANLTEEQIAWFAGHSEELRVPAGEIISREGDPAEWLFVLLKGSIRIQRESAGPDGPTFVGHPGDVGGVLPFSRMTQMGATIRATTTTWGARLHKNKFPEMLEKIPPLLPKLIAVMADRIREVSRVDQQRDKLMALGKLSAGLAHELNNPASAARRAAEGLLCAMAQVRDTTARLDCRTLSNHQRSFLAELESTTLSRLRAIPALDSLTQSDREDEIAAWLESRGVTEAWKLSSPLVEAGLDRPALEEIAEKFDAATLGDVLQRFTAAIAAEKLVHEIESSTGRISDLVCAIKEYSYMDQNPEQEIDIHQGIESTLIMLKFRLKKGVQVIREYDQTIPRICARGSELNQVWTNLIDNAVDAMNGTGELKIRTSKELDRALIEFIDNGPGIPENIKDRIFEPFFTTKGVGEGTGLGLDTVYRIVRSHHGQVTVDSRPGQTRFQVSLPFQKPKEGQV